MSDKSKLVESLITLATEAPEPWSARLYIATANWLMAELVREGDPTRLEPELTIACEKVKKRELGPEPDGFRGCVDAWLDPK